MIVEEGENGYDFMGLSTNLNHTSLPLHFPAEEKSVFSVMY